MSTVVIVLLLALLAFGLGTASGSDTGDEETASSAPVPEVVSEVTEKRTATSRTFRLSNGQLETRLFQTPVNYRDEDGDWQPIEQELQETTSGGVTNGDNSFDVYLPEDLDQAPIRVSVEGEWVSEAPLGLDTEPADLQSNGVASYADEDAAASLDYTGLANGLKETITLGDPTASATYHFGLEASAGVAPTLLEDGSIAFRDEDENLVAEMPAPTMVDSAEAVAPADAVRYSLESDGPQRWHLAVEADPEWLTSPDRSFPAAIDPSLTVPQPALDCMIFNDGAEPERCAPTVPNLIAKAKYASSGTDPLGRVLLRFGLTSIPKNASINSATIGLYSAKTASNITKIDLYDVNRSFSKTVSWKAWDRKKSPPVGDEQWKAEGGDFGEFMPTPTSLTPAQRGGSGPGWWNFSSPDLSWLVQRWLSGYVPNRGVLLKLADETPHVCCIERRVEWESSAATNKPYLAVNYSLPASADSQVASPTDGTETAKRFVLTSAWDHSTVEGVKFQYRINPYPPAKDKDEEKKQIPTMPWTDIPTSQVIDEDHQTVSWPIGVDVDDRATPPLYWDPTPLAGTNADTKFQIRAVLSSVAPGAAGHTKPVEAELNRTLGGPKDSTAPIGPGSVDLLTGNFSLSRTDVLIPGFNSSLSFSRSINSAESNANPTGVLGPGWQPASSLETTGATGWQSVKIQVKEEDLGEGEIYLYNSASLKAANGTEYSFDEFEEGGVKKFKTPDEMAGNVLYRLNSTELAFTDPSGTRTIFSNNGSGNEYLPKSIAQSGGEGNQTRMIYQLLAENKRRLSKIIGPAAPGITCPDEGVVPDGCRSIEFTYKKASTWGAPANAGDRLEEIRYSAQGFGASIAVAKYSYDTTGRLSSVWDPRISPNLKETYGYGANNLLTSLAPAGLEPWTFQYDNVAGETSGTRLLSVKRASLVPAKPTAQTTIAYGVALSGSGRPDLTPTAAAAWGQDDLPTDATAIFPPDEVPASPPSSYAHAAIYYMDAEGQVTNVATPPGAGTTEWSVSTAETDSFGNVFRELTPGNRARALSQGAGSVAKSEELDSRFTYSADGTKLLDERGPVHSVRLESGPEAGAIVPARSYRSVQYDVGAPEPKAGDTWPLLPTHETTGALVEGKVKDQQTVQYGYNWTLRRQTEKILDPEGLKIKSVSAYDKDTGRTTEIRQPKDEKAAGSGTTKFIYYKQAGASPGTCEKDIYAGLLCKEEPAAQPSGRDLPVIYYAKYNSLGQPEEVVESVTTPSAATRKSVMTYDGAGRPKSKEITGGDATQVPKVERTYSSTTGLPVTLQFVCPVSEPACDKQTTTTTYDALGRVSEYQDADGITSKTGFDVNGRMISVDDGKGSQTISYDGASGLPVALTDSMAGTFTASYDPDGQMVQQSLPNGLSATLTVDPSGAATALTYTKSSNCGGSCTWLNFEVTQSASGRILTEASTLGSRSFSYDAAGRLEKAQDTPAGGGCTTRVYAFDANSNRTSKTTRSPGVGGVCTESGGTTQGYTYDNADRLNSSGVVYDLFGRVTTLPASLAGGSSLQTSYFSSGMVSSQTQGSVTNTFGLDASMRQRQRVQAGGVQGVEVFHYSSGSDSPAWTQLGETWTRNIMGVSGGLTAIAKSGSGTRLQLTNLHGDIVATASTDPAVSQLELTARTDEFGVPLSGTPQRFGWLGGSVRRTELASGVIQMGARSYAPAIGRFLSSDPIAGGSANAYDYGNADPVNQSDPTGLKPYDSACDPSAVLGKCQVKLEIWMWSPRGRRMGVRMKWKTNRWLGISVRTLRIDYWVDERMDVYKEGFVDMPPPHYLNSYPGLPAGCRGTDDCAENHDGRGTFACNPGDEYQIQLTLKYIYNQGAGVGEDQILEVKAQQGCQYPY